MPYMAIFRVEFKETIAIFEMSTLEFLIMRSNQKNIKIKKIPTFGTKIVLFGYFWAVKTIVISEINSLV